MKKVTAIIGSAQKKATYQAVQEFEKNLKQLDEMEFEYVFLNDYHLEFCRGCKLCFNNGEEHCPLKDERDVLFAKMEHSDGVVFATPNYAFQVSGRMKNFLDRFAYIVHRPRFFGKTFTAIVTQGFFGGKSILKYLQGMGANFGFTVTKGSCLSTLDPLTENQQKKLKQEMKKAAARFYTGLTRKAPQAPSLFRLLLFRVSRTTLKLFEDLKLRDYHYYKEKGWFESDYYHKASLGPIKKVAGHLFDLFGRQFAKHM